jgi:hypothetical protein
MYDMSTILICGAVDNFDAPFSWQKDLEEDEPYSRHEFINPYDIGDDVENPYENTAKIMEPVVEAIEERVDGVIVSWDDDVKLVGATVYMRDAHRLGIPITVWYQGERDRMQIPVDWMCDSYHTDRDTSIRVLLSMTGDNDALIDTVP